MSLLKRLNGPAVDHAAPSPAAAVGTINTGELFGRPSAPTTAGLSTGDLFNGSTPPPAAPKPTSALSEAAAARPRAAGKSDGFNELKARVQNRLIAELDPRMDLGNAEEVRRTVEETFASVLDAEGITVTRIERLRLFEAISAEILGFGPIEPLLKDAAVTEIMVNGPKQVYAERGGKLEL